MQSRVKPETESKPLLLAEAMPVWHHREQHSIRVRASLEETWDKLLAARARDLKLSPLLMWVRSGFRRRPDDDRLLIHSMPPREIAARRPHELLMGFYYPSAVSRDEKRELLQEYDRARPQSLADFRADRPGWTRLALNFLLVEEGACTRLSTETRAFSADERARRRFAPYWWAIRLGSGLIRREMLRVIARTTPVPNDEELVRSDPLPAHR